MSEDTIPEPRGRSVWQVLTVFLAAGWLLLQVLDVLTQHGLVPEWAFRTGVGLLLLMLPFVLVTAVVQRRAAVPGAVRVFTWRNALLTGGGAFAALAAAIGIYFALRSLGIGPAATLAAQGVFDERERIVLADFGNATADSTLGRVVTEALRIDLTESAAIAVLTDAYVADALRRTGRSPDEPLTAELAREIAVRDGIKAIVHGEIARVGAAFVLTASITDAAAGAALAGFRESASDETALLDAIDRLSERIRAKAGESLRAIRAGEALSAVTTRSLDALRAYTAAIAESESGDGDEAIRLLESALELDPEFAMAHRRLAVELNNLRRDPERARAAAARAYELRDRLAPRERLVAEGYYHRVNGDRAAAAAAYRQLLRIDPDNPIAINNLSLLLDRSAQDLAEGAELLERAAAAPGSSPSVHWNLVNRLWALRRDAEAEAAMERFEQRRPDSYLAARVRPALLVLERRYDPADEAADSVLARFASSVAARIDGLVLLAAVDAGRGRLAEARAHLRESARAADDAGAGDGGIELAYQLGLLELFAAESTERARAAIRGIAPDGIGSAGASFEAVAQLAIVAALTEESELGRAAREHVAGLAEPDRRSPLHAAVIELADWADAMARADPQSALEAIERMQRVLYGDCASRRCMGSVERGLAFEQLERWQDAIGAYETHLEGSVYGAEYLDAVLTPFATHRLAELYERQGSVAKAAELYARFAERWSGADAELEPRVRRARERAAELLGH